MNKIIIASAVFLCTLAATPAAHAFKLSDLLGNKETITNLIEGVFSTSDITVADMAGQWTVDGSAVSFKSENLLSKAGGIAATAAIKDKIDPYFKKYGLIGGVFTIDKEGNFNLKFKKMSISGTITQEKDGNFLFNFTALGLMNIGSMRAYVQKTRQTMDIMFDATKMKQLLSTIGTLTGSRLASSAAQILSSYDGLYVGFGTTLTGAAPDAPSTTTSTDDDYQQGEGSSVIGGFLEGIFGNAARNTQQGTQQQNQNQQNQNQKNQQVEGDSGMSTLFDLMGVGNQNKNTKKKSKKSKK